MKLVHAYLKHAENKRFSKKQFPCLFPYIYIFCSRFHSGLCYSMIPCLFLPPLCFLVWLKAPVYLPQWLLCLLLLILNMKLVDCQFKEDKTQVLVYAPVCTWCNEGHWSIFVCQEPWGNSWLCIHFGVLLQAFWAATSFISQVVNWINFSLLAYLWENFSTDTTDVQKQSQSIKINAGV